MMLRMRRDVRTRRCRLPRVAGRRANTRARQERRRDREGNSMVKRNDRHRSGEKRHEKKGVDRRDFLRTATLTAGAAGGAAAGLFGNPTLMQAMAQEMGRSETPLRAAFSNAGLQATWCAQGKAAAEYWGRLYNVDVTWFDGELSAPKQRSGHRHHGDAGLGFRRDPGVRHRHPHRSGEADDRQGHPRHRHGHPDRPARGDRRPLVPGAGQRVHGRFRDAGAGRRDGRRGRHRHDAGRAGPHRRTGSGRAASTPSSTGWTGSRCSTSSPPTGTSPRRRASGTRCSRSTATTSRPPSSTTTTWRSQPPTS